MVGGGGGLRRRKSQQQGQPCRQINAAGTRTRCSSRPLKAGSWLARRASVRTARRTSRPAEPLLAASPSSKMVRPSPGPPPLPAGCPWLLPSLSVLVGWCRLAGLVHTVPLSLAGYLEGYLTTELLPTGPLLWQPGGSSTPGLCQSLPLTQKVRRPDA